MKLSEELDEYLSSGEIEELADLQELIYAIIKFKNISAEEFEKLRHDKALKNGAFDQRLFLKDVKNNRKKEI